MRQALGKGLDALIPGISKAQDANGKAAQPAVTVKIDSIKPNRLQPRKHFDDAALAELADSIRRHGLAQPILVTQDPAGGYELVAGERRLRAAKLAGLAEIPAMVHEKLTNQERLAIALIENIQRENLNAVESAQAYRQLMNDFSLSQAQVAEAVGKSRSAVANTLRLLELPEEIQQRIIDGALTEGHGRALLMVEDIAQRKALCQRALVDGLSVRELEEAARMGREKKVKAPRVRYHPVEIKNLETDLQHGLGTKVRINLSKKGVGSLVIEFYSIEDLERLSNILKK
jgi:ParB family chromosome partitioning protein